MIVIMRTRTAILAKGIKTSEHALVHVVKIQIKLPQIHDAIVVPIEESLPPISCVFVRVVVYMLDNVMTIFRGKS